MRGTAVNSSMYTDLLVILVLLFIGLGALMSRVFVVADARDARDRHEPIYPEGTPRNDDPRDFPKS